MAVANTFIPGLKPQNPHYIPGYTGHCPLLRFSMGQTYGQVTGQLLRGPPGLAWPPAHRTLLPPIQSPRSVISRGRLPPRRGHERLCSSIIPGYTGFIPQAQFIFAKNCNQVWAEAVDDFMQRQEQGGTHELSKEAKGGKEEEKNGGPEAEEPELKQEVAQASAYSMDDTDPQKFFMSGERMWVMTKGRESSRMSVSASSPSPGFTGYVPRVRFLFGASFPVLTNQALLEFGHMRSRGRAQKDPKLSSLPRPSFQNLGLLPHYGGYVPGYKFQFGGTFGHLTQDALGLSTTQKQLPA